MMYGFSIAYITLCVGVETPSFRPRSTSFRPSHGSSSRLPRSRSSAIDAFMMDGARDVKFMTVSSVGRQRYSSGATDIDCFQVGRL
jgi:hypothetical protein